VIRASSQLEIIHAGDTQYFEKIKAAQMAWSDWVDPDDDEMEEKKKPKKK
jgi:hypothetical protein